MPDDSNGIYSVPAGTIVTTGDTILPSQHNPWANDSASAISARFSKDGRAPATGNWNLNNFRIMGLGDAVASGDAVSKSYADGNFLSVNAQSLTAAQQGRAWANIGGSRENDDLIINGCFDVAQRGASQTAVGYGSIDRYRADFSGGTVTTSRQGFAVGDTIGSNVKPFFARQVVSGQSSGTHFALHQHRIEDVRSYAGQTITYIEWFRRSSGSGDLAIELAQNFGTGGSPSAEVTAIGAQKATLSTLWQPFAFTVDVPSIAGKTLGTNDDSFLAVNVWTSAGSDFAARAASLGLQTIGVDRFGGHIRKGVVPVEAANYYSPPPIWETEPACMRYLRPIYVRMGAVATGVQALQQAHNFPRMRKTPNASAINNPSTVNCTQSIVVESPGSLYHQLTAAAAGTAYGSGNVLLDAEL